jgi:hypothetical protein
MLYDSALKKTLHKYGAKDYFILPYLSSHTESARTKP